MRAAAGVALLAGLLTACHGGVPMACPAVGYGSVVRVQLTGDWSDVAVGSVGLVCSAPCERVVPVDEVTGQPVEGVPAGDPLAWPVQFLDPQPDSAVATVVGPDGTELARVEADLDFQRVGGSEECGGPMEATVEVPAP